MMLAVCNPPGAAPKLLPRANAWLRHRWFAGFVRRNLEEQASHLKGSIDQKVRSRLSRPTAKVYDSRGPYGPQASLTRVPLR